LSELVDRIRAAGQPIEFHVVGAPHSLTAEVELILYRVLQEALTNALKHAPRRQTVVRIDYQDPAGITADVTTTGVAKAEPARVGSPAKAVRRPGRGLAGLRQRVEAAGGELSVAAAPDGGFWVRARLPV
jgi:signal transduction histidine kinase